MGSISLTRSCRRFFDRTMAWGSSCDIPEAAPPLPLPPEKDADDAASPEASFVDVIPPASAAFPAASNVVGRSGEAEAPEKEDIPEDMPEEKKDMTKDRKHDGRHALEKERHD